MNIVGTIPRSELVAVTKLVTSDPALIAAAENQKYYAHGVFFNAECGCVVGAALVREQIVEPDIVEKANTHWGRYELRDLSREYWFSPGTKIYEMLNERGYCYEGTYKVLDD
jgi:hypothetical protein